MCKGPTDGIFIRRIENTYFVADLSQIGKKAVGKGHSDNAYNRLKASELKQYVDTKCWWFKKKSKMADNHRKKWIVK